MKVGDQIAVDDCVVITKKTAPPPYYTDPSLIEAMSNVHRTVKDERLRKILQEAGGLGTQRTQSDAIEKNITDEFLYRDGDKLLPTPMCREVMPFIDDSIKDPVLTAKWEAGLKRIETGEMKAEVFMNSLDTFVRDGVKKVLSIKIEGKHIKVVEPSQPKLEVEPLEGHGLTCPKCKKGQMVTRLSSKTEKRFLGCSNFSKGACKHAEFPE